MVWNNGDQPVPWVRKMLDLGWASCLAPVVEDPFAGSEIFELEDRDLGQTLAGLSAETLAGFVASRSRVATRRAPRARDRRRGGRALYDCYERGP